MDNPNNNLEVSWLGKKMNEKRKFPPILPIIFYVSKEKHKEKKTWKETCDATP